MIPFNLYECFTCKKKLTIDLLTTGGISFGCGCQRHTYTFKQFIHIKDLFLSPNTKCKCKVHKEYISKSFFCFDCISFLCDICQKRCYIHNSIILKSKPNQHCNKEYKYLCTKCQCFYNEIECNQHLYIHMDNYFKVMNNKYFDIKNTFFSKTERIIEILRELVTKVENYQKLFMNFKGIIEDIEGYYKGCMNNYAVFENYVNNVYVFNKIFNNKSYIKFIEKVRNDFNENCVKLINTFRMNNKHKESDKIQKLIYEKIKITSLTLYNDNTLNNCTPNVNSNNIRKLYLGLENGIIDILKVNNNNIIKLQQRMHVHSQSVNDITLSSNNKLMLTCSSDSLIKLIQFKPNYIHDEIVLIGHNDIVNKVISMNSLYSLLASCSKDGSLKIWSPDEPKTLLSSLEITPRSNIDNILKVNSQPYIISVLCSRNKACFWNINTNKKEGDIANLKCSSTIKALKQINESEILLGGVNCVYIIDIPSQTLYKKINIGKECLIKSCEYDMVLKLIFISDDRGKIYYLSKHYELFGFVYEMFQHNSNKKDSWLFKGLVNVIYIANRDLYVGKFKIPA